MRSTSRIPAAGVLALAIAYDRLAEHSELLRHARPM
jgi:hypothetical protein